MTTVTVMYSRSRLFPSWVKQSLYVPLGSEKVPLSCEFSSAEEPAG